MPYNPDIHHRRSIRLKEYDYSQDGFYFVTICVNGRLPLFGRIVDNVMHLNEAGIIIEEQFRLLPQRYPHIICREYRRGARESRHRQNRGCRYGHRCTIEPQQADYRNALNARNAQG